MAIEKNITFEGVSEKNMTKVFTLAYRRAFTKSVEYLFSKVFEYAPVGKTKSGVVNLRIALKWDFDWKKNEGFIGVPKGSEMEKIAFYTEIGTGERGLRGWQVWFDEKKPQFTVPIVPLKAKAMHFVNERGEDVFLKKSKGQRPQAWMRRAFYDHRNDVTTIWKKEFSDSNMKKLLKLEKI